MGITLEQIALQSGLHKNSITAIKHGPRPRPQRVVAQAIGLSPLVIWPSRYDPQTGRPLTHSEWTKAQQGAGGEAKA